MLRKTKEVFPLYSPSYIHDFYHSVKPKSDSAKKANSICDKMKKTINSERYVAKNPDTFEFEFSDREKNTPYIVPLLLAKQTKIGNCHENSLAAMAVLLANGYNNSKRVHLTLQIQFINKKTGKIEYSNYDSADHAFVLTDMNKSGQRDIVIDPWLDFADFKCGAIARFKLLYDPETDETVKKHEKLFMINKLCKGGKFNADDYETKINFLFDEQDLEYTDYQFEQTGDYSRTMFDNIMINKDENQ